MIPDNIARINELHRECVTEIRSGAKSFLSAKLKAEEIGERLLIEKRKVRSGDWLLWLEVNCPELPERTAQWYMKLASRKCLEIKPATRKAALPPVDLQAFRKLLLIGEVIHPPIPSASSLQHSISPLPADGVQVEMVGLVIKRWLATVFRSRLESADEEQLRYWLEYLQPAADAVAEIRRRLALTPSPP